MIPPGCKETTAFTVKTLRHAQNTRAHKEKSRDSCHSRLGRSNGTVEEHLIRSEQH